MTVGAPKWNPQQYLLFERERTRPCRDLVARVELDDPQFIADLGCGPGNSTAVLAERWQRATITGVDNSPEMLKKARASAIRATWVRADLREWEPDRAYDLLFSNAVFHWVEDQEILLPRLLDSLRISGVLAFQIPSPAGVWRGVLSEVASRGRWRGRIPRGALTLHSHPPQFYYDLLAPRAAQIEIWETEYIHVLPNVAAIVEWIKGSALRSVLDALSPQESKEFIGEYTDAIGEKYEERPDGKVLFPFRRIFVVAQR